MAEIRHIVEGNRRPPVSLCGQRPQGSWYNAATMPEDAKHVCPRCKEIIANREEAAETKHPEKRAEDTTMVAPTTRNTVSREAVRATARVTPAQRLRSSLHAASASGPASLDAEDAENPATSTPRRAPSKKGKRSAKKKAR